jgi:radical SAM protein with 4Fe4S-binding SPASM domain
MPCVGVTIPLGNVREQKLAEILRDSEEMQDLKDYRGMIKGPCSACHKLEECYGCRGTAYQMTGDYLASDPTCWKNLERREDILFLPVDAARVVPHQPPILMLDRLLEVKERASVSEMTVRADMPFVTAAGELAAAAYPEIVSQAIAAQEGFRKLGSSNPFQEGYLLGIKNFRILGTAKVGDNLLIAVHKAVKYGDFGIIHGEVRKGGEIIARGEIKVWQNEGAAA